MRRIFKNSEYIPYALATLSAFAVANIYYCQPIMPSIGAELGYKNIEYIPAITLLGYSLGLITIVPHSDNSDNKKLIRNMLLFQALSLFGTAISFNVFLIIGLAFFIGVSASVAQVIPAVVLQNSTLDKAQSNLGIVVGGLLTGVLLSRALSGWVTFLIGWRGMYFVASIISLVAFKMVSYLQLKHDRSIQRLQLNLYKSMYNLWFKYPELRGASLSQAALFAAGIGMWTILPLQLSNSDIGLNAGQIGSIGLLGVVGVISANLISRIKIRAKKQLVVAALASFMLFGLLINITPIRIISLLCGVVILEIGLQGAFVINQHLAISLDYAAKARLNALFMAAIFISGSVGAYLAFKIWEKSDWDNVIYFFSGLLIVTIFTNIYFALKRPLVD